MIPIHAETLINPYNIGCAFTPIVLANLRTSDTPPLVDWFELSLSPLVPAVVAVTNMPADVYVTVMKWPTSARPQAARQSWKRKSRSIVYDALSRRRRTDQFDPMPSAEGDTCWRIVTGDVNGHEGKSNSQGRSQSPEAKAE